MILIMFIILVVRNFAVVLRMVFLQSIQYHPLLLEINFSTQRNFYRDTLIEKLVSQQPVL